jgi:hypothetical protein
VGVTVALRQRPRSADTQVCRQPRPHERDRRVDRRASRTLRPAGSRLDHYATRARDVIVLHSARLLKNLDSRESFWFLSRGARFTVDKARASTSAIATTPCSLVRSAGRRCRRRRAWMLTDTASAAACMPWTAAACSPGTPRHPLTSRRLLSGWCRLYGLADPNCGLR